MDRENVRCPHCGESYYKELYSTRTSVYYHPIYKDGININPDRNTTTTNYYCLNCGKDFSYSNWITVSFGEYYEDRNNIFNQTRYMDVSYIANNKMLFRTRKSLFWNLFCLVILENKI